MGPVVLLADRRGATAAEYVLVLALVAVASIGAFSLLGDRLDEKVTCVAGVVGGGSGACGAPDGRSGGAAPAGASDDIGTLLPSVPSNVLDALRQQGTEIVLSRDGLGGTRPDLADTRPRGWPAGTTFGRDGRGLFDPSRNQIVVALGASAGGTFSDAYVAAHEIGHAIDLPRALSSSGDFLRAYDASSLGARSREALEESFADSFAMFVTDRAGLRASYPALERYWADHISQIGDASPSLLATAGDVIRPFGWGDLNPINQAKRAAKAISTDPLGAATRFVTPWPVQAVLSATGRGDAPKRFVLGGAHAVRDMGKSVVMLAGATLLAGADSLRATYEVATGNPSGSTARRTDNPFARSFAASFEEAGRASRRTLRDTPRGVVTGTVQMGADIVSGDPYRMGYGLTSLGLSVAPVGGTAGRAGTGARLALSARVAARAVRTPRARTVRSAVRSAADPAEGGLRLDRALGRDEPPFAITHAHFENAELFFDDLEGRNLALRRADLSDFRISADGTVEPLRYDVVPAAQRAGRDSGRGAVMDALRRLQSNTIDAAYTRRLMALPEPSRIGGDISHGIGEMHHVNEAWLRNGSHVALKVQRGGTSLEHIESEAKIARELEAFGGPRVLGIVRVHRDGVWRPALAIEHMDGVNLGGARDGRQRLTFPITDEHVRSVNRLFDALDARGLDLADGTPWNFMATRDGRVRPFDSDPGPGNASMRRLIVLDALRDLQRPPRRR